MSMGRPAVRACRRGVQHAEALDYEHRVRERQEDRGAELAGDVVITHALARLATQDLQQVNASRSFVEADLGRYEPADVVAHGGGRRSPRCPQDEGDTQVLTLGADTHKASRTMVVVDDNGCQLARRTGAAAPAERSEALG
jgi:hypothetical protein